MRKMRCKHCSSLSTKRFGTYTVGINRKAYKKQRFLCLPCKRSFTIKHTQSIGESLQKHLVKDSLEGRSSMRVIGRRKSVSKNTVSLAVITLCKQVKDSIWLAKRFQPKWGHVLQLMVKSFVCLIHLQKIIPEQMLREKYLLKKT